MGKSGKTDQRGLPVGVADDRVTDGSAADDAPASPASGEASAGKALTGKASKTTGPVGEDCISEDVALSGVVGASTDFEDAVEGLSSKALMQRLMAPRGATRPSADAVEDLSFEGDLSNVLDADGPTSGAFGASAGYEEAEAPPFSHLTVMRDEVLRLLDPQPDGVYVDVTLGGGGHSEAILQAAPGIKLIGLDRDPMALLASAARLERFGHQVTLCHARFSELEAVLDALAIAGVDGIIADLGVSSPQLDQADRGFSFMHDGPLDMRMNPTEGPSAADLVNGEDEATLKRIFSDYGEERFAGRIAAAIVKDRVEHPFTRTRELASMIERVVPRSASPKTMGGRGKGGRGGAEKGEKRIHPATRVFQALRIAVNEELRELEDGLAAAFASLKPGGRMAIISFHSLEDRIVKQFFRAKAATCVCPPQIPVCVCGKVAEVRVLTPKPLEAGEEEVAQNPRARSARLRVAERLI